MELSQHIVSYTRRDEPRETDRSNDMPACLCCGFEIPSSAGPCFSRVFEVSVFAVRSLDPDELDVEPDEEKIEVGSCCADEFECAINARKAGIL